MARIITSLDKGLCVLSKLAEQDSPFTLTQLTASFSWDKSTVYRTLETLRARDFVVQGDGGYTLGAAARRLGRPLHRPEALLEARQRMQWLAQQSRENAHLAALGGLEMVFVDTVSLDRFTLNTEVGGREPLHCTAVGKAYLMTLDQQSLEQTLAQLAFQRFTKNTLATPSALLENIAQCKQHGYAVDDCEYSPDVRCAAAPILDHKNRFAFAVGVSAPTSRVSAQQLAGLGAMCATAPKESTEEEK